MPVQLLMAVQAGIRTFAVRLHMPLLTVQCACIIPADAVCMSALQVKRRMESSQLQLLYKRTGFVAQRALR